MFQFEVLDAGPIEKMSSDAHVVWGVGCRRVVGDFPCGKHSVWVYGAGRSSVKASLSYVFVSYDFKHMSYDSLVRLRDPRGRRIYLLGVPRGVEIAAGMLISDVPPDAGPGQTGE
jgi:hypothetical protein